MLSQITVRTTRLLGAPRRTRFFGGHGGLYFLSTSSNLFVGSTAANGADTVVGETGGNETVFGGTHDVVYANSSSLTFIGNGGNATINGGAGNDTVYVNSGSNIAYYATPSGSPATIAELIAGAGNNTISAATATAAAVEFVATSGNSSLVGGTGDDTFFAGMGDSTFTGGGGDNDYAFESGAVGGTDIITDFKSGDILLFLGYGNNEASAALATETQSGGFTTITLTDNTKIVFVGYVSLNGSNVESFCGYPGPEPLHPSCQCYRFGHNAGTAGG